MFSPPDRSVGAFNVTFNPTRATSNLTPATPGTLTSVVFTSHVPNLRVPESLQFGHGFSLYFHCAVETLSAEIFNGRVTFVMFKISETLIWLAFIYENPGGR